MSTTPLDDASADRPARAVARILKTYGFEPQLNEHPQFPRIDSIDITFSSHEEEQVGELTILDILNENGYQCWLNRRGSRWVYLEHISVCDPGSGNSEVHQTIHS